MVFGRACARCRVRGAQRLRHVAQQAAIDRERRGADGARHGDAIGTTVAFYTTPLRPTMTAPL